MGNFCRKFKFRQSCPAPLLIMIMRNISCTLHIDIQNCVAAYGMNCLKGNDILLLFAILFPWLNLENHFHGQNALIVPTQTCKHVWLRDSAVYRPYSYCIDQAGLGAYTAKSGRKHYNPPPLTVMWMNFDSPNFPILCSLSAIISFQICSNKCILYVLLFHKCIKIKYKTVNMYGVFLWLVQSSSHWNTIHSLATTMFNCWVFGSANSVTRPDRDNQYNMRIVYTHLNSANHSFDNMDVIILDKESRWFERGVKEALYVTREQPSLNKGGGLRHNLAGAYSSAIEKIPQRLKSSSTPSTGQ